PINNQHSKLRTVAVVGEEFETDFTTGFFFSITTFTGPLGVRGFGGSLGFKVPINAFLPHVSQNGYPRICKHRPINFLPQPLQSTTTQTHLYQNIQNNSNDIV